MLLLTNLYNNSDRSTTIGKRAWLSTVFVSFLIIFFLAGIGGLLLPIDDNANSFAAFIALSMGSVFLAFRFPKVLSFHRITLEMAAISILVGAALGLIPFGVSGSRHLAPYMDYALPSRIAFIVFLCGLLPVIEEIYFRGLLYPIFSRYIGYRAGAIITVALFTLVHFPPLNEVFLLVLSGALYTWLVYRSGSVLSGILAHAASNICWLIIALRT